MTDSTTDDTATADMLDDEIIDKSTDPAPEHVDTALDDDQPDTANRDAAKYRRRLRDVEAQRDALADRLETMQRREIERLASAIVKQGAAVWLAGDPTAAFLDDDGEIDPHKVAETAHRMRKLYAVAGAARLLAPREGTNPGVAAPTYTPVDVVMGRNRD